MSGTRSFVAVELPPQVSGLLGAAGAALRDADPRWRGEKWVAQDNLHITLKFLGPLLDVQLSELRATLGSALAEQTGFELVLGGVRGVPSRSHCSMVWATFDDSDERACARLAGDVDRAAATVGVALDTRPFKPHVTLVRARRARSLRAEALTSANAALPAAQRSMSVPSVTLFASTLTPRGPVYERLQTWPFRPAGVAREDR